MSENTDIRAWRVPRHLDTGFRFVMLSLDEFVFLIMLLFGGILSGQTLWSFPAMVVGIWLLRRAKTRWRFSYGPMVLLYWFTPALCVDHYINTAVRRICGS